MMDILGTELLREAGMIAVDKRASSPVVETADYRKARELFESDLSQVDEETRGLRLKPGCTEECYAMQVVAQRRARCHSDSYEGCPYRGLDVHQVEASMERAEKILDKMGVIEN